MALFEGGGMRGREDREERADPWKAVHRIKHNHEAVVRAAQVVVNCAEWQGETATAQLFLVEAIKELKAALAKLTYTQPPGEQHD